MHASREPLGYELIPQLSRDVAINVLANLMANIITAAGIYLLGVATGLLPFVANLAGVAFVIVGCGALLVLNASDKMRSLRARAQWRLVGAYVLQLMTPAGLVFVSLKEPPRPDPPAALDIYFVVMMTVCFLLSFLVLRHYRRNYLMDLEGARQAERTAIYRNRPNRHRASREPRIIRRQRLPQQTHSIG